MSEWWRVCAVVCGGRVVRIIITIVIIIIISPRSSWCGLGSGSPCVEAVELGRAPGPVTTSSLQTRDRFWPGTGLLAQARLTP